MNGAREYCKLFRKAQQIGRLYMIPSHHARGKTFRIYVLPEGEKVIENGGINPPCNVDAVEVYGVIGGQRGWSESYGWLHRGPWQADFFSMCDTLRAEALKKNKEHTEALVDRKKAQEDKEQDLLSTYPIP